MKNTTVLIVGAGPAGAACAGRLQQAQVDYILLDKQPFPRMKPCAGWITPRILHEIGFRPEAYPYGFTTFTQFLMSVRGVQFTLPTRQYAIRRVEFDQWLLQRADIAVEQHTVKTVLPSEDGYQIDGEFFGKYLIGAGGTYCPVYRTLFRETSPRAKESLIVAMEEEFAYPHTDPRCRLWFMEDGLPGYAWYVPKANGILNIGIGAKAEKLKQNGDNIQSRWQSLTGKLEQMGLVSGHAYQPVSHTYYLRQNKMGLRKGNAFLTGDAAGLATLDMGEGIGPALISGLRAAEAIITGADYTLEGIPRYSLPSILWARLGRKM